jgi:ELP3 family radical SAM enzyme/protein acetyltransferase
MFKINITEDEYNDLESIFNLSHSVDLSTRQQYDKFMNKYAHNKYPKTKMILAYRNLLKQNKITRNLQLEKFMVLKLSRGNSGVVVITIFTSPTQFGKSDDDDNNIKNGGCPMNCHYCPFEKDSYGIPTQPRSYLSTEPGNKRATQNKHHPVGQMFDRTDALEAMGHIPMFPDINNSTKCEIIISGGTFNFYPKDYIKWFVTSMYYAANTYYNYKYGSVLRDMLSLEEEQKINETSFIRVIGLTIETRPDYLIVSDKYFTNTIYDLNMNDLSTINFFRELGITRVQIGIQHTNDDILKFINRQCTNEKNKQGIKILKQNGFKVDIHLMLDLPSSSPEEDMRMLDEVLDDPNYQVDQWKIYPTEITPFTKILEWYNDGYYKPYAEINPEDLENVIIHCKKRIPYRIRINRVIRDIPPESIYGGIVCPDMRKNILEKMEKMNMKCKCIRCREIKSNVFNENDMKLFVDEYESSGGFEYYISYENNDRTQLYGHLRLRINYNDDYLLPYLRNCALIRELHVYGKHTEISSNNNYQSSQHRGIGRKLVKQAENIALSHLYSKIVVISGIGVKEYYRKLGYSDYHTYLAKDIKVDRSIENYIMIFALIIGFMAWCFRIFC